MKRTQIYLGLVLLVTVVMFASCKTKEETIKLGKKVETPCLEKSFDDVNYFRALGTATNVNYENSRKGALKSAKDMVKEKLGGFVKGISEDYSRVVSGQAPQDKIERLLESDMTTVVEKELNDAMQTCETTLKDDAGNFITYITIEISKEKLLNKMENTISQDEELSIEFNREQFRKYAEEKMKKMKQK